MIPSVSDVTCLACVWRLRPAPAFCDLPPACANSVSFPLLCFPCLLLEGSPLAAPIGCVPSVRRGPGIGGIIASASAPATLAAKPPTAESFTAGVPPKAFLPPSSVFGLLLVFQSVALPADVGDLMRCEASAGLPFSAGLAADWALWDAVMTLSAAPCTAGGSCWTSWKKASALHTSR